MIQFINLINNITNDISIINKNSIYYISFLNIIAIGLLLILNIFYFLLYYYDYYYKNDIYVRTNIKWSIILNIIALVFVLITLFQANYSYIFGIKPLPINTIEPTPTPTPIPTKII